MSTDPNEEALQTPAAAPAAGAAVPTPEPASTPETADSEWSVETLPAGAQKMIRDLRAEAAGNRTKATEQATALETTRDAIAKALGLKGEDDPVKAAQTAAEQRDAAQLEAKKTRIENAVLRMANKNGADPDSLTDSRSFMSALEALDSAAADFREQVDAAIKKAVESNPNLKIAAPPARSSGPVGGGKPQAGQLDREDLKDMSPEQIEEARKAGRLDELLGIKR